MQVTETRILSSDGTSLAARKYVSEGTSRGEVAIVHGHGDHQGRYVHVAEALVAAGYTVHSVDLRGHGRSPGRRGHTPAYRFFMDDIEALVAQMDPARPKFLLGHSMGGNLVLGYARLRPHDLRGLVVLSPLLRVAFQPPRWKTALGRWMAKLKPDFAQTTGLDPQGLARDPQVISTYQRDPLVHSLMSARLFVDVMGMGEETIARAGELALPMLLIHGAADPITSEPATKEFYERLGSPDKTFVSWPELRHETFNEPEKGEVFAKIIGWLDSH